MLLIYYAYMKIHVLLSALHENHKCLTLLNPFLLHPTVSRSFFFPFNHFDHFTDGRTPWTSHQLVARLLSKHRINTYTYQTSMPCVGYEPTIPASERGKTVHALDRSATVTGTISTKIKNSENIS
jgi:hypothetical protein